MLRYVLLFVRTLLVIFIGMIYKMLFEIRKIAENKSSNKSYSTKPFKTKRQSEETINDISIYFYKRNTNRYISINVIRIDIFL